MSWPVDRSQHDVVRRRLFDDIDRLTHERANNERMLKMALESKCDAITSLEAENAKLHADLKEASEDNARLKNTLKTAMQDIRLMMWCASVGHPFLPHSFSVE